MTPQELNQLAAEFGVDNSVVQMCALLYGDNLTRMGFEKARHMAKYCNEPVIVDDPGYQGGGGKYFRKMIPGRLHEADMAGEQITCGNWPVLKLPQKPSPWYVRLLKWIQNEGRP